jgi:DNA-binding response OmpR family regulator
MTIHNVPKIAYAFPMNGDEFTAHGCEQVLRFSRVENWDDLSEAVKVQLAFNMGVVSLGLKLPKEDGYQPLVDLRERRTTMKDFHDRVRAVVAAHNIAVDETKITRPF